jgi:methylated-DNA-[protein]-cysteine S-methyltransferase
VATVSTDEELVVRSMESPVGTLRMFASARGLRAILWADEKQLSYAGLKGARIEADDGTHIGLATATHQLGEYFDGRRTRFDLALDPVGTEFQMSAWRVLTEIPYGTTINYAQQARALGDVRKARAVGGANGRNPIPVVVPCHRVIGSDGSLTGFAVGTPIKKFLLDLEREHVSI